MMTIKVNPTALVDDIPFADPAASCASWVTQVNQELAVYGLTAAFQMAWDGAFVWQIAQPANEKDLAEITDWDPEFMVDSLLDKVTDEYTDSWLVIQDPEFFVSDVPDHMRRADL